MLYLFKYFGIQWDMHGVFVNGDMHGGFLQQRLYGERDKVRKNSDLFRQDARSFDAKRRKH